MATKKRPAKKKTAAKRVAKKQQSEFWTARFTFDTVAWLIIGVMVVAIAVWTYKTNLQVNEIYDQIQANNTNSNITPVSHKKHSKTPATEADKK
jgi:hypothetical protein